MAASDRDELRDEFAALVRAFRVRLEAYQRAGVSLMPGEPTPILMPADQPEAEPAPGEESASEATAFAASGAPDSTAPASEMPDSTAPASEMPAAIAPAEEPPAAERGRAAGAAATWPALVDERPPADRNRAAAASTWPAFKEVPLPASGAESGGRGRAEGLAAVRAELGDCRRCKLAAGRQHIVFGVGDPEASLMFVGEAPGANEDRVGEPFVGAAGQLLDKMIEAMGWHRGAVYIANVVKCRPPRNRTPERDEIDACQPFLAKQIDTIGPRVIVALGKPASQLLLNTNASISSLRGSFKRYRGIAVMPTFHPAFLLRSPQRKRDTWRDLKLVIAELERLGVRSPRPPK